MAPFFSPLFTVNRSFTFRDIWETRWPNEKYSQRNIHTEQTWPRRIQLWWSHAKTLGILSPVATETEMGQSNPIRIMQNVTWFPHITMTTVLFKQKNLYWHNFYYNRENHGMQAPSKWSSDVMQWPRRAHPPSEQKPQGTSLGHLVLGPSDDW